MEKRVLCLAEEVKICVALRGGSDVIFLYLRVLQ